MELSQQRGFMIRRMISSGMASAMASAMASVMASVMALGVKVWAVLWAGVWVAACASSLSTSEVPATDPNVQAVVEPRDSDPSPARTILETGPMDGLWKQGGVECRGGKFTQVDLNTNSAFQSGKLEG